MSIFIDIRKAFDTVDYQVLLHQMRGPGINGVCLRWFESYLYGRSLKVVLNDIVSSSFPVKCDVPQDSYAEPFTLCTLRGHDAILSEGCMYYFFCGRHCANNVCKIS